MIQWLVALGATGAMFLGKWLLGVWKQQDQMKSSWQAAALEILQQHRGPISSAELRSAVENRIAARAEFANQNLRRIMIGYGTWFGLMDELAEQHKVRKIYRPNWFGYELDGPGRARVA